MDGVGIGIFVVGLALYFIYRWRKVPGEGWLFVSGIGLGILIAAIWAYYLVMRL